MSIERIGFSNTPNLRQIQFTAQPEETAAENKEVSEEKAGMSNSSKWMIGATAVAAVAALGIAGYKGHLGKGIQKFLGGAEKAADAATNVTQQAAEKYKGLVKADKDETIAWLKSKNIEPKVTDNEVGSFIEYTAPNGREVTLTYFDKKVLSSIDSDKGNKSVYLNFADKKLSEFSRSSGVSRVYDDGKVIDDTFRESKIDVTARFRPNKENHVKLTKEKALNLADLNFEENGNVLSYTNKKGKDIKLSFNEDGTFAKAETLTKKSES